MPAAMLCVLICLGLVALGVGGGLACWALRLRRRLRSVQRFEGMVEEAPTFVCETDPEGMITYANPAACAHLGYAREELVGTHYSAHVAPAYRDRMRAAFRLQVHSGTPTMSFQFPVLRRDGEERWLEQTSQLVTDEAGVPTCLRAMSHDVTDSRVSLLDLQLRHDHLREEVAAARAIHKTLLPSTTPRVAGLEIGLRLVTADELAGDYIEFLPARPGADLAVYFADITGHGIPAALLGAMMKVMVGELLGPDRGELDEAMATLNARVHQEFPPAKFASAVLFELDAHDRTLRFVKAAQEPILLHRPGEGVQALEAGGPALGLVAPELLGDANPFETRTLPLRPGDTVILYTDGLTELEDETQNFVGRDRLVEWIEAEAAGGAQDMTEGLCRRALAFAGRSGPQDDMTILAIRVK